MRGLAVERGGFMSVTNIHTFEIGDVHGRADLLRGLLEGISSQPSQMGFKHRVVFLGTSLTTGRKAGRR